MRQRGFCTWGIQTGPFAACWADFVPKCFHPSDLYTGESNSLLPQRVEMRKKDSPKNGWDTGVSVPGAFKLDHLQPVKLILSHTFSIILIFILGSPIPYYPREWKWEKGIRPNMVGTQRFLYLKLDHLQHVKLILSIFTHPPLLVTHTLYCRERKEARKEGAGPGAENAFR